MGASAAWAACGPGVRGRFRLVLDQGPPPRGPEAQAVWHSGLGALQGFVGWWMVSSGLVGRVEVAQERLAIHLLLAAFMMSACLWVAEAWDRKPHRNSLQRAAAAFRFETDSVPGVCSARPRRPCRGTSRRNHRQHLALDGGRFSLFADTLWRLTPWWSNIVDNPITAQFLHRLTAYVLLALTLMHMLDAVTNATGKIARGSVILFAHVILQASLGVATLVLIGDDWMERRTYCWRWGTKRSAWASSRPRPCKRAG